MKAGVGLYIILGDSYALLSIKDGEKGVNVITMIISIYKNFFTIIWTELVLTFTLALLLHQLDKRFKKIPWFFLAGVLGGVFGYLMTKISPIGNLSGNSVSSNFYFSFSLLKEKYKMDHKISDMLHISPKKSIAALGFLRSPKMWLQICGVELITIIEVTLMTQICNQNLPEPNFNIRLSLLGIGATNFVNYLFGLLPVTTPVGRNTMAILTGANHRIYHLLNIICMGTMLFVLLPVLGFIPSFVVKALNLVICFHLIDIKKIVALGEYNWNYVTITVTIVLLMPLCGMVSALFIGIFLFFCFYKFFNRSELEVWFEDDTRSARVILGGRFGFRKKKEILEQLPEETDLIFVDFGRILRYDCCYLHNYRQLLQMLRNRGNEVVAVGITKVQIEQNEVLKTERWIFEFLGEGEDRERLLEVY